MSLNGALQVGRSAITASQAALQVAGNNMANAATPGYHRRAIHLAPARDEIAGRNQFIGQGVQVLSVDRVVDEALQARRRDAIAQESGAQIDQRFLTALETIQNELTDNDLSSLLSEFFNGFSELANAPEDDAVRAVVVQQGIGLADRVRQIRTDYNTVLDDVDRSLGSAVEAVNDILDEIAALNGQIAITEQGRSEAGALRDRRDLLLDRLAEQIDIGVVEQPTGAVDVFVGSVPIVLAGASRGVEIRYQSEGDAITAELRVASDGTQLDVSDGRIGALIRQRDGTIQPFIDALDELAGQLVFQVNRLHAGGQGQTGFGSVTGTTRVDDATVALNLESAGVPFEIDNGSFFIHVTNTATGIRSAHRIDVDGDAMSLDDVVNEINVVVGVPNVAAGVGPGGELTLAASAGFEISFSEDTSGALAALGVNTFFAGEDAASIEVNPIVRDDLTKLAVGAGHVAGSNGTAVAIAGLPDVPIDGLGGKSLRAAWQSSVNELAVKTASANAAVDSTALVRDSVEAQIQAVSGVSIDEESINLLTFQRQFQAAARFIATIDETIQTLLSIA